jgi:two-component system chemotaxis response regulator CheY
MAYDLSNLRVLIVDPSPFRRMLVADVLNAIGINQVESMNEGSGAYSVFRSMNFDIVITEQIMVPLDGLDLTRMIRTSPDSPNPAVPILMLVSAPRTKDVISARDAGITEFMAMPFSVNALYNRLVFILEQPRQFIQDGEYFGPDRRRTVKDFLGDDQRVLDD